MWGYTYSERPCAGCNDRWGMSRGQRAGLCRLLERMRGATAGSDWEFEQGRQCHRNGATRVASDCARSQDSARAR